MRNTPGFGGYLLAWAVSIVMFSLLFTAYLCAMTSDEGAFEAFVVFVLYGVFVSMPFAAVGIPLVHLACRTAGAQWVHVLVAGAVGLLPLIVFGFLSGDPTILGAPFVPLATAVGRWSVVPLVERRRHRVVTGAAAVVV